MFIINFFRSLASIFNPISKQEPQQENAAEPRRTKEELEVIRVKEKLQEVMQGEKTLPKAVDNLLLHGENKEIVEKAKKGLQIDEIKEVLKKLTKDFIDTSHAGENTPIPKQIIENSLKIAEETLDNQIVRKDLLEEAKNTLEKEIQEELAKKGEDIQSIDALQTSDNFPEKIDELSKFIDTLVNSLELNKPKKTDREIFEEQIGTLKDHINDFSQNPDYQIVSDGIDFTDENFANMYTKPVYDRDIAVKAKNVITSAIHKTTQFPEKWNISKANDPRRVNKIEIEETKDKDGKSQFYVKITAEKKEVEYLTKKISPQHKEEIKETPKPQEPKVEKPIIHISEEVFEKQFQTFKQQINSMKDFAENKNYQIDTPHEMYDKEGSVAVCTQVAEKMDDALKAQDLLEKILPKSTNLIIEEVSGGYFVKATMPTGDFTKFAGDFDKQTKAPGWAGEKPQQQQEKPQ